MTLDDAEPVRVAVIGAGAMGTGIAQIAAQAGCPVTLVDAVDGAADAAVERLRVVWDRQVAKGRMTQDEADQALARVRTAPAIGDLPGVDLVIEAAREDLATKRELFTELARTQSPETVLATNTSSLSTTAIADGTPHPDRLIGLHFFNPPPLMALVEVVRGSHNDTDTGRAVLADATELMRAWGKAPVLCSATPGFIVNRVARPFYGEGQRLVADDTLDAATLDHTLTGVGFRLGPMALTDLIGQDVNLAVGQSVWEQTGRDPRYEPTDWQRDLVAAGRLGRKAGRGVFDYDASGQATGVEPDLDRAAELTAPQAPVATNPVARTLAMLVNEAVDMVARGEASADDVDVAMRLGTGYPRGPIAWGREIGFDVVRDQLLDLDAAFPSGRYRPSPALTDGTVEP
jgi:3-hydroxybutyryl-CoA dehydrogenase